MYKILNGSLAAIFLLVGCFESEHAPYVRVHSGNFEVASKSFIPENGTGPKVTLLGAVHIGERQYYQAIQKRLDLADRVLFERIGSKPESDQMKAEVSARCPENLEWMFPDIDHGRMAKILDLTEQMKELDYNKPHFVHADMSMREFIMSASAPDTRLCDVISANKEAIRKSNEASKASRETFMRFGSDTSRNLMALVLAKKIDATRETPSKLGVMNEKLVIFDRNDVAMKGLRSQLDQFSSDAEIVVFYGAAHMKDLEESLQNLGYKLDSSEWLKAFSL